MRDHSFGNFIDKKKRDNLKELRIIGKMLQQHGMRVENFLEDDLGSDPYIYCHSPVKHGSFDGIRIYKTADIIAFRVQKESKTHPYGRAYKLPIEDIFNDMLEDENVSEEKAGRQVMDCVLKEIRRFFEKSNEVEADIRKSDGDNDGLSLNANVQDYSTLIHNKI